MPYVPTAIATTLSRRMTFARRNASQRIVATSHRHFLRISMGCDYRSTMTPPPQQLRSGVGDVEYRAARAALPGVFPAPQNRPRFQTQEQA